jgi:periplasmic protein TonB
VRIEPLAAALFLMLPILAACEEAEPITPPRQLPGSPFHYPEELWDAGVEGETVLRLWVNEEGAVDTVRVERTSDYPAFDSAAVNGARDLQFEPARQAEGTVGTWVLLPVQFDLPGSDSAGVVP